MSATYLGTPHPRLARNFFINAAPRTPRIFLFLALNPLVLLLIRFWGGSRRTRAARNAKL